jgi:chloramphenicol 3-O-phosphotransferase
MSSFSCAACGPRRLYPNDVAMRHPESSRFPRPSRPPPDRPRIVVVGPCASGKSTLVAALQELGYDAHVSGQEHSEIASLWQRSRPDVLIALDADIGAVRARRGWSWPEWLHAVQLRRLRAASTAADLRLDTSALTQEAVANLVLAYLQRTERG